MTTLANAPLIEVMTEFRWGVPNEAADDDLPYYQISESEKKQHLTAFSEAAEARGFTSVRSAGAEDEDVFRPLLLFRPQSEKWPVYQLGFGTFVINQGSEGYDWGNYKSSVLNGLRILRETLQQFYTPIPFIGMELTYLDGFFLDEGETPEHFLRRNLRIGVRVPSAFQSAPFFKEKEPWLPEFRVQFPLARPEGMLSIAVRRTDLSGRQGFIMETAVLSVEAEDYGEAVINVWLDSAHDVQKHAFNSLIKPAFLRSFK